MKASKRRLIHTGRRVAGGEHELDRLAKHIRREDNGCCSWSGRPLDQYEALNGRLPSDVHVHHQCENPGCVNPFHLVALDGGDHSAMHAAMRKLD